MRKTVLIVYLLCCLWVYACEAYHMSSECLSTDGQRIFCHPDTERCDWSGVGCQCQVGAFPYYNPSKQREVCIRDTVNSPVVTNLLVIVPDFSMAATFSISSISNVDCIINEFNNTKRYQCSKAGVYTNEGLCSGVGYASFQQTGIYDITTGQPILVQVTPCICANGYNNVDEYRFYDGLFIFSSPYLENYPKDSVNPIQTTIPWHSPTNCRTAGCSRGATSRLETQCGQVVNPNDLWDVPGYSLYEASDRSLPPIFVNEISVVPRYNRVVQGNVWLNVSSDSTGFPNVSNPVYIQVVDNSITSFFNFYYSNALGNGMGQPPFTWGLALLNYNSSIMCNQTIIYRDSVSPIIWNNCSSVFPLLLNEPQPAFYPFMYSVINTAQNKPSATFQTTLYQYKPFSFVDTLPYQHNECTYGRYGPSCTPYVGYACEPSLGTLIDSGKTASGKCVCIDPSLYYLEGYGCIKQFCKADVYNPNEPLCSGRGYAFNNSYGLCTCQCNYGYTGMFCEKTLPVEVSSSVCDCGVTWLQPVNCDSSYIYDILDIGPIKTNDIYRKNINTVVGHLEQAKYLCYLNSTCAGFMISNNNQNSQRNIVWFFGYYPSSKVSAYNHLCASNPLSTFVYKIDRNSNYACSSYEVDTNYYLTTQSQLSKVMKLCLENPIPQLRFRENVNNSIQSECNRGFILDKYAKFHWQRYGHITRINPNPSCTLFPTLYDASTKCYEATPGCSRVNQAVPCSGNGYCLPSNTVFGNYSCSCKVFPGVPNEITMAGFKRYTGTACQEEVINFCLKLYDNMTEIADRSVIRKDFICNGQVNQCKEGVTEVNGRPVVLPGCRCADDVNNLTPWVGTYCERTRCPGTLSSNPCNVNANSNNVCAKVGPRIDGSVEYKCKCAQAYIGSNCSIPALECLDSLTGLRCAGKGVCFPASPELNMTTPYCNCTVPGYYGPTCNLQTCPSNIMYPGRGICVNNVLQRCFKVYQGSTCQLDLCATYNGTIKPPEPGNEPTECLCPVGWSASQPQDVTCWPECPLYNGEVCGGLVNTCIRSQSPNGTRIATCQCADGWIPFNNNGSRVCTPFCLNGGYYPSNEIWNPNQPAPCTCDPSSGYRSDLFNPRCDKLICNNNGLFISSNRTCSCKKPWLSNGNCAFHSCNNNPVLGFPRGYVISYALGMEISYECRCNAPHLPKSQELPYDCDGDFCGAYGSFNTAWTSSLPTNFICKCKGLYRTSFTDYNSIETYSWCLKQPCLNGGYPDPSKSYSSCLCPFPYYSGTRGICENIRCNIMNTEQVNGTNCICKRDYTGIYCDIYNPFIISSSSSSSSSTGVNILSSSSVLSFSSSSSTGRQINQTDLSSSSSSAGVQPLPSAANHLSLGLSFYSLFVLLLLSYQFIFFYVLGF